MLSTKLSPTSRGLLDVDVYFVNYADGAVRQRWHEVTVRTVRRKTKDSVSIRVVMANDDKLKNDLEARAANQAAERERKAEQRRNEAAREERVAAGFNDALERLRNAVKSVHATAASVQAYSTIVVKFDVGATLVFDGRSANVRKWEKLLIPNHVVVHLNNRGRRSEEQWKLIDVDGGDAWQRGEAVLDNDGLAKRMLDFVLALG